MTAEEKVSIRVDGLSIEGMLCTGSGPLAAVVLHPHPQYGGDMDNHVVTTITDTLREAGATTLRVNFRGVGASEGLHQGGQGEADDARAALAYLGQQASNAEMLLIGYSFGAMIAAAVAAGSVLDGLVLVSPPMAMAPLPPFPSGLPILIVTGELDPVSPAAGVRELESRSIQTLVVPGANHGWMPGVAVVADAALAFAQWVSRPST